MKRSAWKRTLALAASCQLVVATANAADVTTIDPPAGFDSIVAAALSADGSTVTGTASSPRGEGVEWGFVWTEAHGLQLFEMPPGVSRTIPRSISANGSTVVGDASLGGLPRGFVWTQATGVRIVPLPEFGFYGSYLTQVSADGSQALGVLAATFYSLPFLLTADGRSELLGLPPGKEHLTAVDASDDFSVIAGNAFGLRPDEPRQAYRKTAANGFELLPQPAGVSDTFEARFVAANGAAIAGRIAGGASSKGFVWTTDGVEIIWSPVSRYGYTNVLALSDNGSTAAGVAYEGDEEIAWTWTRSTGLRQIDNPSDYPLMLPRAVSADGSVVVGTVSKLFGRPLPESKQFRWTPSAGTTLIDDVSGDTGVILLSADGMRAVTPQVCEADGLCHAYVVTETPDGVDTTPPVISPSVVGLSIRVGWYNEPVAVSWNVTDRQSVVTSQSGCDPQTVTQDTVGVTFTCTATSAGGTRSQSVTVRKDEVRPIDIATASPAANIHGWNNSPVTVAFSASDATSGVDADACTASERFDFEGSGISSRGGCIDRAGNRGLTAELEVNIDKTAPTVTILSPVAGANYGQGTRTNSSYACTDSLSGIETCGGSGDSGTPFDTSDVGPHTFVASGTDFAGNNQVTSVTYNVTDRARPEYVASPDALSFGNQELNVVSAPLGFTLLSSGGVPLPITSIELAGRFASQFSYATTCGKELPVGGSCRFTVWFAPTAIDLSVALLNIDMGPAGTMPVRLSGVGVGGP